MFSNVIQTKKTEEIESPNYGISGIDGLRDLFECQKYLFTTLGELFEPGRRCFAKSYARERRLT